MYNRLMFWKAVYFCKDIYRREKLLVFLGGASVIFMFISGGILISSQNELVSPIVLHQDRFLGTSLLGDVSDVWQVWFLVLFMVVLDIVFAVYVYYRERFLTYAFLSFSVILGLIMVIIVGTILHVNS